MTKIEEIKKHAEELKKHLLDFEEINEYCAASWAADQILALVAEIDILQDRVGYNDGMLKIKIEDNTKIEKLTNANKILRDKLVDVKSQLEAFKCNACSTNFKSHTIDEVLVEADEVLK